MSAASLAQRLAVSGSLPRLGVQMRAAIRVGLLVPMTGAEEVWGRPGLNGCQIWVDWINERGGMMIDGRRHLVELVAYDSAHGEDATLDAARRMVETQNVRLILTLGGPYMGLAYAYLMERRILTATLLPSDLSPDHPTLIAPAEVHPFFVVTGVDWMARTYPEARRIALCSQKDPLGLPSLATYRAACRVANREVVAEVLYDNETADVEAIVAEMLASDPDILCWCSSPPPTIDAMSRAAYRLGFKGRILVCTCDTYRDLLTSTSPEFMERFTFQFPDFDDPALESCEFFFRRPKAFFETYNQRFPNEWSAVSWEYASILDIWHEAVETAGSLGTVPVMTALKRGRHMPHAFGMAKWWGEDIYGIDNALVGDWPVVSIRNGKAVIEEFGSVLTWLEAHKDILIEELGHVGQLWHQRVKPDLFSVLATADEQ